MEYTIIIEKAKGNYSGYCPDLPGCISTGKTIEETKENMREAIQSHIELMKEQGEKIPEPSYSTLVTV
jgi:predicted RNase H-like HicB family nuclease